MSAQSAAEQAPATEAGEANALATQLEAVSTALVKIDKVAAGVAELRAKYQGVLFDVTTTKGMKEACEARAEIREPRYDVEKLRKAAKRPILDLGKKLDTEAERITNELLAIEGPIDAQITSEQTRKENEKKAREAVEAARIAAIRGRIEDDIRAVPLAAMGRSARDIGIFIKDIEAMVIDHTFAEFQKEAEGAKATTLIRLRAALANAQAMEAEQARLATERVENDRIRKENESHAEAERARLAEVERIAKELREKAAAEQRARLAEEERVAKVARDAEAARQAEILRLQREENDRIEAQRQAARDAEERRLATERAEADRVEAERKALADAETQRLADERAQLERDLEQFRLSQKPPVAAPLIVEDPLPAPETAVVETEASEPLTTSIDFKVWLAMDAVCKAAKEWANFQHPDSKADQKTDRKLKARARDAETYLLAVVGALPEGATA